MEQVHLEKTEPVLLRAGAAFLKQCINYRTDVRTATAARSRTRDFSTHSLTQPSLNSDTDKTSNIDSSELSTTQFQDRSCGDQVVDDGTSTHVCAVTCDQIQCYELLQ